MRHPERRIDCHEFNTVNVRSEAFRGCSCVWQRLYSADVGTRLANLVGVLLAQLDHYRDRGCGDDFLAVKPFFPEGAIPFDLYRFIMVGEAAIVGYAMALPVFYFILRKKCRNFRIGLTMVRDGAPAEVLRPTMRRTLRIWWTYTWRAFIHTLVLSFVANIPMGFLLGALEAIFPPLATTIAFLGSTIIAGAVGLFVIYSNILDEDFSDFRVSLLPRNAAAAAPASEIRPAIT